MQSSRTCCLITILGYLLCYWCDTDGGSSGAPVVKVEGKEPRVIALHRGSWSKGVDVNFGTLITTILDHVKGQTFKGEQCALVIR